MQTLSKIEDKHFGEIGTPKRDELEEGYKDFKKIVELGFGGQLELSINI